MSALTKRAPKLPKFNLMYEQKDGPRKVSRLDDYELVRVKRNWVPEWLFFWANAFGAVAWFPPFTWLFTRKVDQP